MDGQFLKFTAFNIFIQQKAPKSYREILFFIEINGMKSKPPKPTVQEFSYIIIIKIISNMYTYT
jgi:hypothetical protein